MFSVYYWLTQDEYLSIKKNNIDLQSVYTKRRIIPSNRIKIKCIDLNMELESCYKVFLIMVIPKIKILKVLVKRY